jgi:hypothetical protein
MAEESSSGLTTAVQLALRAAAAQEVEDDEPVYDLLGFQTSEVPKRANLARAGMGRPPGSRNHTTQFWLDYISRKYGSPLEVLGQMMRMPIDDLARELSCSKLDAYTEKRRAAEALAPYLHPKLSSVAIYPPGDIRGGIASRLILESQDFDDISAAAIVENADGDTTIDAVNRPCTTLSLAEQEPAAAEASGGEAKVENQVSDATIAQALDTLLTLARDPKIRRRMREMLE